MQTIVIVVHLLIVIALVGAVLMQRSEGGGLGIGGGGSNMMSARGTGNPLTRVTAFLAAAFFATSLTLSLLARYEARPTDIFDRLPPAEIEGQGGVLDQLGGEAPTTPAPAEEPADPTPQVPTGQ